MTHASTNRCVLFALLFGGPLFSCASSIVPAVEADASTPAAIAKLQLTQRSSTYVGGDIPPSGAVWIASFQFLPPSNYYREELHSPCAIETRSVDHPPVLVPAGTVAIVVNDQQQTVSRPNDGGAYVGIDGTGPLLPDDRVTFEVGGAVAPASVETLRFPAEIQVVAPSPPRADGRIFLDLRRDLDVSWRGGNSSAVHVVLELSASAGYVAIRCRFAAESGHGTIPGTLIQSVEPMGLIALSVHAVTERETRVGDWIYRRQLRSMAYAARGP